MASSTPFTVAFYEPNTHAKDGEGRTLNDILSFSDSELEYHHDFIQYLFPLPERSPINPYAPVIDKVTRDAFLSRPELRKSLFRSVVRIAQFYAFEVTSSPLQGETGQVEIFMRPTQDSKKWTRNSRLWRTRFSHNHLRITRIIRCLRFLGMEKLARGFHQSLLGNDSEAVIGERTKMFWERAARRPLRLAPEEEGENAGGVAWLREEGNGMPGVDADESGFDAQSGRIAVLASEEVGTD